MKFIESVILIPGIFIILLLSLAVFVLRTQYKRSGQNKLTSRSAVQKLFAYSVILVAVLLYVSSTPIVAYALIRPLENSYTPPKHLNGDVLVMLGAGATFGTPALGGSGNLTGDGANRLLTTAILYKKTKLPVVLTGLPLRSSTSPSLIAKRNLVQLGVPPNKILMDNHSLNTQQNAVHTKSILKQHGFSRPILITSAYHMQRAVLDFKDAGVQVIPYPCGYRANTDRIFSYDSFFPSADALNNTETAIHEYAGIAAVKLGIGG